MWKKNILFFSCKIALSRHDQVILIRIRLKTNFTDSRITKKCQPAMNCSNSWTRYVSRPVWEWESYFSCSYSMYLPKKKASWGSFLQDSAHCGHNHRSFTLLEFGDSFQKSLIPRFFIDGTQIFLWAYGDIGYNNIDGGPRIADHRRPHYFN